MRKSKVNSFCKFHNISRRHLIELAGVSNTALIHYENGTLRNWKLKTRIEIAMQVIDDFKLIYKSKTRPIWEYENDTNEYLDKVARRHIHRIILMEIG